MNLQEKKLNIVAEFLFKYCDPKPHFSGVSARELGRLLLNSMDEMEENYQAELNMAYQEEGKVDGSGN